jgi:hypothetical protein
MGGRCLFTLLLAGGVVGCHFGGLKADRRLPEPLNLATTAGANATPSRPVLLELVRQMAAEDESSSRSERGL